MYYVIYNDEVSIWVYETEAFEKMANGWILYAIADSEEKAERFTEEACYV